MGRATTRALAAILAIVGACAPPPAGEGPVAVDYPIVLRGEAPDYAREATVERIADGGDLSAVLRTYRFDGAEDAARLAAHPSPSVRWWLVVPPAQPSGGYRLRVTLGDGRADACLAPPRGAATTAFVKSAYLVGLPRNAAVLRWRGACPSASLSERDAAGP